MKNMKKVIWTIGLAFLFAMHTKAATNPYEKVISLCDGCGPATNCTWYAWQKVYDETGVALAGFGNAKNWYRDAKNKGYTVGSEPKAHAVVVWDNYLDYGHVGYVERVEGDTIYVWDSTACYRQPTEEEGKKYSACMNSPETGIYECEKIIKKDRVPCEYPAKVGEDGLIGYIYTDIPRKTSSSTTPSKDPKPSTNPEPVKSKNNNLSSLNVSDLPFEFHKDITEYTFTVPYEVEAVEIDAVAEDSKATVIEPGSYIVDVGENHIVITVKAEDGSKKEYTVIVHRQEKVEEEPKEESTTQKPVEETKTQEQTHNEKKSFWTKENIIILSSVVGVTLVGVTSTVLVRKRRKLRTK